MNELTAQFLVGFASFPTVKPSTKAREFVPDFTAKKNSANPSFSGSEFTRKLAKKIAAVILVNSRNSAEWGDRDSLDLPGGQLALLQALAAGPTPLVLVTVTGRTPSFGGPSRHTRLLSRFVSVWASLALLNAIRQSRVTLSLRYEHTVRAACQPRLEERKGA